LSAAVKVYIALGSNIQPEKNLPAAVKALGDAFGCLQARSSAWQTPAVGSDGPDFLNAVVLVESELTPGQLKFNVLRPLEEKMGRVRVADKNAPRTIDMDVLLYDDELMEEELWQQAHLAVPLAEIYPGYTNNESGESLEQVAERLNKKSHIICNPEILL
jgi:2-amino-4-hydroxy-6-hydroxymethyldihydropteridine diphosphokinase